jgi:hypothetical protein
MVKMVRTTTFSLNIEIWQYLSLSSLKTGTKNNKNKLLYQN